MEQNQLLNYVRKDVENNNNKLIVVILITNNCLKKKCSGIGTKWKNGNDFRLLFFS